jgi:hypothetical protein
MAANACFSIGDFVHQKLFDYRGVIVDVDPQMMLSDEWYEAVARSRPPKDQTWYRVLVHNSANKITWPSVTWNPARAMRRYVIRWSIPVAVPSTTDTTYLQVE